MQIDLLNLTIWSQHWNLNFNVAKCALLWSYSGHSPQTKKTLSLSLVHSQLTYCSQIWHPHLLKDIIILGKIQHCVTKYILNEFTSDYRSRLIALRILPLMVQLELYDVMFFIRSLKGPTNAFNIDDHVTFHTGSTCSSTHLLLKHVLSRTNSARHFYSKRIPSTHLLLKHVLSRTNSASSKRIPRLGNSLPTIDLDQSTGSIKLRVQQFLWDHFICSFKSDSPCTYHFMWPCSKCSCLSVMYNFNSFVFRPLVSANGPSVHVFIITTIFIPFYFLYCKASIKSSVHPTTRKERKRTNARNIWTSKMIHQWTVSTRGNILHPEEFQTDIVWGK